MTSPKVSIQGKILCLQDFTVHKTVNCFFRNGVSKFKIGLFGETTQSGRKQELQVAIEVEKYKMSHYVQLSLIIIY